MQKSFWFPGASLNRNSLVPHHSASFPFLKLYQVQLKTSCFSSDVTQQKILYFRGREKAVQLLYSSSSAAYCLAPHTRSLPASLLASKWFSTLLSIQKEIRTDGANLTKEKTHSFGITRAGSAAQRVDLCWKSTRHPAGLWRRGAGGKNPGPNIINQLQEDFLPSSETEVYFYHSCSPHN